MVIHNNYNCNNNNRRFCNFIARVARFSRRFRPCIPTLISNSTERFYAALPNGRGLFCIPPPLSFSKCFDCLYFPDYAFALFFPI